ncbi:sigma-E factor negative regulatory protein RseC [Rheinheimera pacifica]|uniref:SoxR reducing system RseC family protein n=1 Tax=Rheinheimera pacifica TaxID=173990 RepID=UPI00216A98D5|nr:SoxR reducing system RseC family protein [Rheinheimera pacifica]MCS4305816.1 sigma-E factor negative regulatory protein RseC [Rheinheimera pacifica]
MVEEIATVAACEGDGVWLTTTPVASCNACNVSDDCGTGIIAKTLTPRQQRFFVATALPLLPGEQVKIGLNEQSLIMAALMVYLLPLVLLILLALLGNAAGLAEGWVMLLALAGTASGFMLARRYGQLQEKHSRIVILAVLPSLGVQQHAVNNT